MKDLLVLVIYFTLLISFLMGIVVMVIHEKWSWTYIIVGMLLIGSVSLTVHI